MAVGTISVIVLTVFAGLLGFSAGGLVGLLILGGIGLACGIVYAWAIHAANAYDISLGGIVAFVVDVTWSLPNTLVGALFLALNVLFGNELDKTFKGRNIVGLRNGVFPGFATTIGPVQARTYFNDPHEAIHVLQARLFGPLYLPLVVANYVVATILPYWLLYHDSTSRPIDGIVSYFRFGVYPHVWNEEWAYRVAG